MANQLQYLSNNEFELLLKQYGRFSTRPLEKIIIDIKFLGIYLNHRAKERLHRIKQTFPSALELNIDDKEDDFYSSIEAISCNQKITYGTLIDWLSTTPNLESLFLSCEVVFTSDVPPLKTPSKLRTLHLGCSSIHGKALGALLRNVPYITSLTAYSTPTGLPFFDSEDLSNDSLNHLTTINFSSGVSINGAELKILLSKAPHLQSLVLFDCKNLTSIPSLDDASLNSLEILCLGYTTIDDTSLKNLLVQTHFLRSLDLSYCKNLHSIAEDLACVSQHLETLDLGGTDINDEELSILSRQFPQLKSLSLSNCDNLHSIAEDLASVSQHLETLDLHGTDITDEELKILLRQTPRLKLLSLSNCDNLHSFADSLANVSQHLETLYLALTRITHKELKNLLSRMLQLKSLHLNCCAINLMCIKKELINSSLKYLELRGITPLSTDISQKNLDTLRASCPGISFDVDDRYKRYNSKKVSSLDFSNTKITDKALQDSLLKTTHLRKLNLSGCAQLHSIAEDLASVSQQLETLNLNGTDINDEELKTLLLQTPHLTKLYLSGCANITASCVETLKEQIPITCQIIYNTCRQIGSSSAVIARTLPPVPEEPSSQTAVTNDEPLGISALSFIQQ